MYPYTTEAIRVEQPFGTFHIASLPARLLLDVSYSDRLKAVKSMDGSYQLSGSQRRLDDKRLREIGGFIDTGAACFPNAIILAANYVEENGLEEEDAKLRWAFESSKSNIGSLEIPSERKLAAIIDGQHRLFGFNFAQNKARLDMPLVCAIFFDLPKPYQARLFATINANQRPVNKSQTFELFGYNLEEEPPAKWSPEKFAVFIARRLNADLESPLCGHVVVPAENEFSVTAASARKMGSWAVSLATIVEGVLRLISANPKLDANQMTGGERYLGKKRDVLALGDPTNMPLRGIFRECNDALIYTILINYFKAVANTVWAIAPQHSFIFKTVGIQALFDIAKTLIAKSVAAQDVSEGYFQGRLNKASSIDFAASAFSNASGAGRVKIRRKLEEVMGLDSARNLM